MISASKKFIFIHIPRTGGTSLSYALRKYGTALQGRENYQSIYFKHATGTFLQERMGSEFGQYHRFTIVRNPWDWAVSNYRFNRGLHRPFILHDSYEVHSEVPEWSSDWDFSKWLKWWLMELRPSQVDMIADSKGNILVDTVLRFERLQIDYLRLCMKLRLMPRFLSKMYISSRTNYRHHYSPDTQNMIKHAFAREIDLFNYTF